MKTTSQRLIYLFHWAGFICLAYLTAIVVWGILTRDATVNTQVALILLFQPQQAGALILEIVITWLAALHYPIKWILTGNKSFFPWKS